jgi:ribonuclease-3
LQLTHLGYSFHNPALLHQALTHRSAGAYNNERLEFLGDSVLNTVISHWLYSHYPRASEGALTRLRATLVRKETLVELAANLSLRQYLLVFHDDGSLINDTLLANAFEALLGALYLDADWPTVQQCVLALYAPIFQRLPGADEVDADDSAGAVKALKDAKTRLQEWLQARARPLPVYRELESIGKAHNAIFKMACFLPDVQWQSEGVANSKRRAEQQAAAVMLARLLKEFPEEKTDDAF